MWRSQLNNKLGRGSIFHSPSVNDYLSSLNTAMANISEWWEIIESLLTTCTYFVIVRDLVWPRLQISSYKSSMTDSNSKCSQFRGCLPVMEITIYDFSNLSCNQSMASAATQTHFASGFQVESLQLASSVSNEQKPLDETLLEVTYPCRVFEIGFSRGLLREENLRLRSEQKL